MLIALAPRRVLARFRPAGFAPLRRIPFPALALAVGLLFAAVGARRGRGLRPRRRRLYAAAHCQ